MDIDRRCQTCDFWDLDEGDPMAECICRLERPKSDEIWVVTSYDDWCSKWVPRIKRQTIPKDEE